MTRAETATGGREATGGVIPGRWAISVGKPDSAAPEGFEWRLLSDLARLESGHTPSRKKPEYWGGAIPWIGVRDATGNHGLEIFETRETVTQAGIDNSSARVLPPGTVCLSRTASVGYVVMMGRSMATSQDFVNWVCGPGLNPRYLKYILQLEQDSIRRFAHGTTHQTMYYPEAKALHVCVPSRDRQDEIAGALGAMDDLIEVNRRLISDLIATADAIASSYLGRGDERSFGDVCDIFGGGTPSTKDQSFWNGDIRWATPSDITALPSPYLFDTARHITQGGLDACSSKLMPVGSILMTSRATIGAFAVAQVPTAVNQGFIAVQAREDVDRWFLFHEMRRRVPEFIQRANGSTFLELSRGVFKGLAVCWPSLADREELDSKVAPLHAAAAELQAEIQQLAQTRDELLPLLMSGRVRVGDVAA